MSTIAKPSQLEPRVEHAGLPAQRVLLLANTAGIAAFFLFFCVNHFLSTGGLSAQSLAFFAGLSFTCLVYGQAFRRAIRHWVLIDFKLPFDMLAGFFVANTLLFIVSLASPLGMKVNALFVFFVSVLIGGLALRRTHTSAAASRLVEAPDAAASPASAATAGAIAVIVSAIAATLWCLQ
ncbi:MAG: hypothetical protein JWP29_4023, partial [Rhodoferax sp.]|nr:hypothetical protein [Rhodoferax sp.]